MTEDTETRGDRQRQKRCVTTREKKKHRETKQKKAKSILHPSHAHTHKRQTRLKQKQNQKKTLERNSFIIYLHPLSPFFLSLPLFLFLSLSLLCLKTQYKSYSQNVPRRDKTCASERHRPRAWLSERSGRRHVPRAHLIP